MIASGQTHADFPFCHQKLMAGTDRFALLFAQCFHSLSVGRSKVPTVLLYPITTTRQFPLKNYFRVRSVSGHPVTFDISDCVRSEIPHYRVPIISRGISSLGHLVTDWRPKCIMSETFLKRLLIIISLSLTAAAALDFKGTASGRNQYTYKGWKIRVKNIINLMWYNVYINKNLRILKKKKKWLKY